jgi:hypothetical protein
MSSKSSSSTHDYVVTPLNGTNYPTWSIQIKAYLQSKGLSKFIRSNLDDLKGLVNNAAKKMDLEDDDEKALGHLKCNMDQSYWDVVTDCNTAFEAWEKLTLFFSGKETFNRIHILEQYIDGRLTEEGDIVNNVQKYVKEKNEAVRRLDSIGIKLDKDLQVAVMLARLPLSFDTMRRILESSKEITLEQVTSELNREAIRRSTQKRKQVTPDVAMISDADGSKMTTSTNKSKLHCEHCKADGHSFSRCWFNPKSTNYRPNMKKKE